MTMWEMTRHQVAISGRVTNAQNGKPVAGVLVSIAAVQMTTLTSEDGHFHFLELANGQHTLTASYLQGGSRYGTAQVKATVKRDAQKNIKMAAADILLPVTVLIGQVTDQNNLPVSMASVRLNRSVEQAFSDEQGNYALAELETGKHTILISARGFQNASQTVQIVQAGGVQTFNIVLVSNP
jgi:hypothetical protein